MALEKNCYIGSVSQKVSAKTGIKNIQSTAGINFLAKSLCSRGRTQRIYALHLGFSCLHVFSRACLGVHYATYRQHIGSCPVSCWNRYSGFHRNFLKHFLDALPFLPETPFSLNFLNCHKAGAFENPYILSAVLGVHGRTKGRSTNFLP